MKKRVLKALVVFFTTSIFLTGCGSGFPEMTEEEYNQTVAYAVSLLMKYSNNGVERLSSVSALEMQKQIDRENREAAKAVRDAETEKAVEEAANNPVTEDGDTTEGTDLVMTEPDTTDSEITESDNTQPEENTEENSDDVNIDVSSEGDSEDDDIGKLLDEYEDQLQEGIDNAGKAEDDTGEDTDTEPTLDEKLDDLTEDQNTGSEVEETPDSGEEEALTTQTDTTVDGMRQELSKGMFLTYSGYSVASSYADENDVFSITAVDGSKLLVLNFKLVNTSGMDVSVDMEKANPHFQVLLNGVNVGYTNVTMLDNDLSSFTGTIPAGAKQNMVLIKQMKADKVKNIETLGLIGTLGGDTITFNLE